MAITASEHVLGLAMGQEAKLTAPGTTGYLTPKAGMMYITTDTHKLFVDTVDGTRIAIKSPEAAKVTNAFAIQVGGTALGSAFNGSAAKTVNFVAGTNMQLVPSNNNTITINNTLSIPTSLKNPKALTWGNKSYDGSAAREITLEDFGITNVLHFLGTTTDTNVVDNSTTKTITIGNTSVTAVSGDIVIRDNVEYIWTGTAWEKLGDENLWVPNTRTVSAGSGLSGGGALSNNLTISHATYTCTHPTSGSFVSSIAETNGHITGYTKTSWSSVRKTLALKINGTTQTTYDPFGSANQSFNVPVMVGTNGTNASTIGLVPSAAAGATTRFLCADATWHSLVAGTGISVNGLTISNAGVRSITKKSNGVLTIATGEASSDITVYSLPAATTSVLGGVKIGSNISVNSGVISLTANNVKNALGVATASADGYLQKTDFALFTEAHDSIVWGTF